MIIAAFPVYPLDILQYLFLIVKILFPDSCLPHFDVCIQIDAEQSLHSVQDIVGAPSDDDAGFFRRQFPDYLRLEPEQVVGGDQIRTKGGSAFFRCQTADNLIQQLISRLLVCQVKIAFLDSAFI